MPRSPAGVTAVVVEILRASPTPLRRRELLEAVVRRGHAISLAGLNRILDDGLREGQFLQGPDGVRLPPSSDPPTAAGSPGS